MKKIMFFIFTMMSAILLVMANFGCFIVTKKSSYSGLDTIEFFRNKFVYLDSGIVNNCKLSGNYFIKQVFTQNYCDIEVYNYFLKIQQELKPDQLKPVYFVFKTKFGKRIEEGYLMGIGGERSFYHGQYRAYHRNGRLYYEGQYDAGGDKIGEWRFYDRKGRLVQKGSYSNGRRIGEWYEYDEEGNIIIISRYQLL